MFWPGPTQPTTPSGWKALLGLLVFCLIVLGGVLIVLGLKAPPQRAEAARQAIVVGAALASGGVLIIVVWRVVRRWLD